MAAVATLTKPAGGAASTWSSVGDGDGGVVAASARTGSRARKTAGMAPRSRFTREILSAGTESSTHSTPIPVQVPRKPLPQTKTTLALGPVAPRRRNLCDAHSEPVSLDCELEPKLETALRLDAHLVQEAL